MTTHTIDWPKLARSIDIVRQHHGLSDRQLAKQLDLSRATLIRLRQGHHVDADTVATLIAWLNPGSTPAWIVTKEPPSCSRLNTSRGNSPAAAASTTTPPTQASKP